MTWQTLLPSLTECPRHRHLQPLVPVVPHGHQQPVPFFVGVPHTSPYNDVQCGSVQRWRKICSSGAQSTTATSINQQFVGGGGWPLTRKRHIPPHSAPPRHTNDGAPRMQKRHQQEHRPQRPTERSDPTQHAKGRTGDCPGPRKGATTRRNVTRGRGGGRGGSTPAPPPPPAASKESCCWPHIMAGWCAMGVSMTRCGLSHSAPDHPPRPKCIAWRRSDEAALAPSGAVRTLRQREGRSGRSTQSQCLRERFRRVSAIAVQYGQSALLRYSTSSDWHRCAAHGTECCPPPLPMC